MAWSSFASEYNSDDTVRPSQKKQSADPQQDKFDLLLSNLYSTDKSQYYFMLGESYYFGAYRSRDVGLAVENLIFSLTANDKNQKAHYLLGTIYAVESEYFNKKLAVKHLRLATEVGDVDALENLYHLYRRGWMVRTDIYPYLVEGKSRSEGVALAYAQEKIDICLENMSKGCMVDLCDFLLGYKFKDREGDAMFLLAKIYSLKDLDIFDAKKRDVYLNKSAALGNKEAIRILDGYRKYLGVEKK
jgi:TPR repeat protein